MNEGKPFEPTQSRLQRARREGDVPRVSELVGVASLLGSFAVVVAGMPLGVYAARAALAAAASGVRTGWPYALLAAWVGGVFLSAATASTIVATALGGFRIVPLKANLARLSPAGGLRRMASRESAFGAARAVVAAGAVAGATAPIVRDAFYAAVGRGTPGSLSALALAAIERSISAALGVGLVLGICDYLLERFKWRRRLRMSFDEMKRDLRQNEGDPLVRVRRRARHRELAQSALSRVREAAFVITNPTHVAVALAYRPPEIAVPRVIVRALDDTAQAVRVRARELSIPIVQQPVLARTLFASSEVDGYIARDCYVAVAQIVAVLLRDGLLE